MMPLTHAAEKALASYLRTNLPNCPPILVSRDAASPPDGTYLLVSVVGADLPDDLPRSAGTLVLTVRFRLWSDPNDDGEVADRHRVLHHLAVAALGDLAALQSHLNAPSSGPDTRAWAPFHLSDLVLVSEGRLQTSENRSHLSVWTYQAVATAAN